jgi:gamma-glutamylcyclotransferase (GGCT)/AIG2-like uncharacterized protein YtfP
MTARAMVPLFSYGTLQRRDVQITQFGRALAGRADALPGYVLGEVAIADPQEAASLGQSHFANAEPSADPDAAIPGTVLELTEAELAAADRYEEGAQYRRMWLRLRSGIDAWVYLRAARPHDMLQEKDRR